jgi:hypothetical protein
MAWRLPAAFPIVLSVAVFTFIIFLPESPRWLILRGRISEAQETLAILEDRALDDRVIETRIEEMQASFNLAGSQKTLAQLFSMGPQRTSHRAFLAMTAMTFLQLTGATVTTYYSKFSSLQIYGLTFKRIQLISTSSSDRNLRE